MIDKPTGLITPETVQEGDEIVCTGDKHIAGFGGTVTKTNRVNLTISALYMGRIPQTLKVRRSDLRGELRALRSGQLLSSLYTP